MRPDKKVLDAIGEPKQFVMGNIAVVYGALLAGCRFYGGYPITPSTEIMEKICELMPKVGGVTVQMEDEIASIASIIGASLAGRRSMTATSGPGFSLMQENIGYAIMTETPCVIVNVMRGGPSTGQPTEPSQGDVMQARWGTHGDHEIIALYPRDVQETLDLTIKAFNLADKYRTPVILLMDAEIGHMREKITIPDDVEIYERVHPTIDPEKYKPFRTGYTRPSKVPEMDCLGDRYLTYHTGLTHDFSGHPVTCDVETHENLVNRLKEKITDNLADITMCQEHFLDDAKTAVISYGVTSRPALSAVNALRGQGKRVGYMRLQTIWPFPEKRIKRVAKTVSKIVVPELNMGQLYHRVKEAAEGNCDVVSLPKLGGAIHTPYEIMEELK